jgi:crotonobetaine/carnitine-CoA ligase
VSTESVAANLGTSLFTGRDVPALLNEKVALRAGHPFLIWAPPDGPTRQWTYLQFRDEVARLAGGLAGRGVQPGDRVLVQLENCPEVLLTWFACAWLGAICAPCNAMATGEELSWFAELTGATCAVTQPRLASVLRAHCKYLAWIAVTETDAGAAPAHLDTAGFIPFADLQGAPLAPHKSGPDGLAAIMFTSGTTARAKAVTWTHANALWGAKMGAMQQALRPEDVYQIFMPLFHVVGLSWGVLSALYVGASVVLQPRFSASRFWPVAIEHGCTVASHVQFMTNLLMQQPVPAGHRFRQWGSSMWVPQQEAYFGVRMIGWWGMTELITQGIIGDPFVPQAPRSIGRPCIGITVRIVDEALRPVAPGSTGQLQVRGVPGLSLFAGYWNNAQATGESFTEDGWFITGDIVTLHADGSIQFADRAKDVIKVGGENVSAAEVERIVAAVPGIRECAAVARADEVYGEVVVVFVAVTGDAPAQVTEAVLARCRDSLSKFKVPREVIVLDSLPRANIGKIAKAELRARLA